jgi:Putative sensor
MQTFFSNPVTWKGMGYLLLKLPMGVISFTALVALLSVSLSLILVPVLWPWAEFNADVDFVIWGPTTFGGALFVGLIGTILLLISLNLFNGLTFLWREVAVLMLGSERFAAPAPPPALNGPMNGPMSGTIASATA